MNNTILIEGIETNNIKNIDIQILKKEINLIIGPSGSGKSSLAYDTIAQIGQHEFMAMFADEINEPTYKVKSFSNMTAAIPIKQSNFNNNMRSTIGTYFGINRGISLLYALMLNKSEGFFVLNKESNLCEDCKGIGYIRKLDYNKIIDYNTPLKNVPFKCWNRYKDFYSAIITEFCEDNMIDVNKTFRELSDEEKEKLLYGESKNKYSVRYKKTNRLSKRTSKYYGVLTEIRMLPNVGIGKKFYSDFECESCNGKKFGKQYDEYKVEELSIGEFMTTDFATLKDIIEKISEKLKDDKLEFIVNNMKDFINKAVELNLGHLYFHRAIPTLSGGELQRLRMVQVFISQLSDLIIVLDEPLAGLSGKEKEFIFQNIILLSKRHTVVLVDHGNWFYEVSNNIIALGEKGGSLGGNLINVDEFLKREEKTNQFNPAKVSSYTKINLNSSIYKYSGVKIPIANNCMNLITGYSGVGKSTLLREYLPQFFESYLYINQKPLLGNKNSCVATLLDISGKISKLFADAHKKEKQFFSNLTGNEGMCLSCGGAGYIEYGNDYHKTMKIECGECEGTGFNKMLKKYKIRDKSIYDIWKMTLDESIEYFKDLDNTISGLCSIASNINLGYLNVGQPTSTLSGGENIRVKILKAMKTKAKVIGIDEPFKGLSNTEIYLVVKFIEGIREKGKTILVADHTDGIDKYFSFCIHLKNKNGVLYG